MAFFSESKERRRDGEALIDWHLEKGDLTLKDIRRSLADKSDKVIMSRGKRRHPIKGLQKASKTRNIRTLTRALKDVLDDPASEVPVVAEFCQKVGLNPDEHTVMDVVVQCQLYFALSGSAPHFMHLFDRVEGKIPTQTELKLDGRAGISEAMASMLSSGEMDQLEMDDEYKEADPEIMEPLTGCKDAEAIVVEDVDIETFEEVEDSE